jgi:predicted porin
MQKKMMAVAIAGALAAPAAALAQTATVNIYGTVNLNYNYVDGGSGYVKSDVFNAHDSNFGIRGQEKLGGGMSAWFQCETSFDPSLGGDGVCQRNSALGMRGAWGNIFAGNWDTPMKLTHGPARIWSTSGAFGNGSLLWNESGSNVGNGNGNAQFIDASGAGFSPISASNGQVIPIPSANGASFTRRQAQTWNWHSPNWGGFELKAGFSAAGESIEGAGGRTLLTSGTLNARPRLWSIGGSYRNGPLYIGAGYESHSNYNPAAQGFTAAGVPIYQGGTDKGWNIAAAYTFARSIKVGAIYSSLDYETTTVHSIDHQGFGVYVDWAISGPHGLRVGYTWADDVDGTPGGPSVGSLAAPSSSGVKDSGAQLFGIQYYHRFSKRTEMNFGYALLNNDARSRHRLQTLNGRNTCSGLPAGCDRDQDAFVLGMRHTF